MAVAQSRLNPLDRLIGWVNPAAGVRRAHLREVLSYYEGARPDRLRKGRRATGSINDDVARAGVPMRQIARQLEQNYDLARGVLNTLVVRIIGPRGIGVEPQPRQLDGSIHAGLARQLMELHHEWCNRPEVTREHDWAGAERLQCRTWVRDGEVLAQMLAGAVPGLVHSTRVPFSLELMEADLLPMELTHGNIVQGVERNAWGAALAYHLHKADPADSLAALSVASTKRVPADRMLHLKVVDRIRQVRGVSIFASVLTRFDDLKDYEESERIAAKIAASMAAYIKKGAPEDYQPSEGTPQAPRQMQFRPGMVFDDLRPGEEIGMIDTNRPNPNLETYRGGQLRAIAAGTGPSYSSVARKYEGSYSSQRQELIETQDVYATLSAEFISKISRPVYERFVAMAVASGAVQIPPDVRIETIANATYMPPAMPWIDPKKEAEGWAILEDRCYLSGPEIIRQRGGNPINTLESQGRWLREKAAEGVPHPEPKNGASNPAGEAPAAAAD